MQFFLASDVIYDERFRADAKNALEKENVTATRPAEPALAFLTDIAVAPARLRGPAVSRHPAARAAAPTPGLHGNGLGTSSLGGDRAHAGRLAPRFS